MQYTAHNIKLNTGNINLYHYNRLETSQFDCSSRGIPSLIFWVGAILVYSYLQTIKTIDNSKEIDNAKQIYLYCPPTTIELTLCSSAFRVFVNQINL